MERFFWVRFRDEEDLTVASKEDGGWVLIGSDKLFKDSDVVVGSEIHPSKTGLLAALNDVK